MKGKKSLRWMVVIVLVVLLAGTSVIPVAAQDGHGSLTFSGGRGTPENPYLLSSKADLLNLASIVNEDQNYRRFAYKLTANIDLGDQAWIFGDGQESSFYGTFDGNNKTITIRKLAASREMGFFGQLGQEALVRNLSIRADINQSISSTDELRFGLLAGSSEGRIENCMTGGRINLTINGGRQVYVAGMVGGVHGGRIESVMNEASLTVRATGGEEYYFGGVAGMVSGQGGFIKDVTNKGDINISSEGFGSAAGVAGSVSFGGNAENLLNLGKVNTKITKAAKGEMLVTGGLVGSLWEGNLDKGLNKGNIYSEYTGLALADGPVVCGIAGKAAGAEMKNVGSEGNLEAKGTKGATVHGLAWVGSDGASVNNAYVKGKIHAYVNDRNRDVYAMGIGEVLPTNNFYVGGSVTVKAGNRNTINADALANIRRGDKTSIYNYCYWNSKIAPFPGHDTINKPGPTIKPVNISTGQLTAAVSLAGKSYSKLSDALNAWVSANGSGYLRWTKAALPTFDWEFGYSLPPALKYKNYKEGKWLDASDWAVEWMEKADRLSIIPASLFNKNMTQQIDRLEFAALALELYEHLAGQKYAAKGASPFKDTNDPVAVKAYELGIITGKKPDEFGPRDALTREQAATMLTRVYKAVYNKEDLDRTGVSEFSDHRQISSYAEESVYFMVKMKIIDGVGNNLFNPRGNASREQAFKIAVATIIELK